LSRAQFQVLIIPFRRTEHGTVQYAALCRGDLKIWQGVAGGGEEGESPAQAAARETAEELGLSRPVPLYPLQTTASIPARLFADRANWPTGTYVVPEHSFAADLTGLEVSLSREHTSIEWLGAKEATAALRFDSNRTALGELDERLKAGDLPDPAA
jgi:dATP pyrophosphohydrolase